jgi:hypothetical protein
MFPENSGNRSKVADSSYQLLVLNFFNQHIFPNEHLKKIKGVEFKLRSFSCFVFFPNAGIKDW